MEQIIDMTNVAVSFSYDICNEHSHDIDDIYIGEYSCEYP